MYLSVVLPVYLSVCLFASLSVSLCINISPHGCVYLVIRQISSFPRHLISLSPFLYTNLCHSPRLPSTTFMYLTSSATIHHPRHLFTLPYFFFFPPSPAAALTVQYSPVSCFYFSANIFTSEKVRGRITSSPPSHALPPLVSLLASPHSLLSLPLFPLLFSHTFPASNFSLFSPFSFTLPFPRLSSLSF